MKDNDSNTDEDFQYFHCSVDGCHDISPGKTSFRCEGCDRWICQKCARTQMKDDGDDLYCLECSED